MTGPAVSAPAAQPAAAAARTGADTPPPPAAVPPLVRMAHVGKRFGNGVLALRDLDLDIGRHEFVSLLGPSGCGKSTALRLIAGLTSPSSGAIEWPERATLAPSTDIGFVFQEPTLMPWASVFDNVNLPLKLQPRAPAAAGGGAAMEVGAALAMGRRRL